MNAPYMGKFKVTQIQHENHDGLDLVGIDSKDIHSTVEGNVIYSGYQNPNNKKEGFGLFVCIYSPIMQGYFYYGHLSETTVKTGDKVKITDKIGVEGYTGHTIPEGPNGSHCHYCARPEFKAGKAFNISDISGIPNELGTYDDGYRETQKQARKIEIYIDGQRKYSGLLDD